MSHLIRTLQPHPHDAVSSKRKPSIRRSYSFIVWGDFTSCFMTTLKRASQLPIFRRPNAARIGWRILSSWRYPAPRAVENYRETGQSGRIRRYLRISVSGHQRKVLLNVRSCVSLRRTISDEALLQSVRITCWRLIWQDGKRHTPRWISAPGAFVRAEPADRETMAAELQRTNPAERRVCRRFAEMALIEGRRSRRRRCGSSEIDTARQQLKSALRYAGSGRFRRRKCLAWIARQAAR